MQINLLNIKVISKVFKQIIRPFKLAIMLQNTIFGFLWTFNRILINQEIFDHHKFCHGCLSAGHLWPYAKNKVNSFWKISQNVKILIDRTHTIKHRNYYLTGPMLKTELIDGVVKRKHLFKKIKLVLTMEDFSFTEEY